MNKAMRQYLKTVKSLLPFWSRSERAYCKRLQANLEDFFVERPPTSQEEIAKRYDSPENVVNAYLETLDSDYLLERMKIARRWRMAARCAVVIGVIAVVVFACLLVAEYLFYLDLLDDVGGYCIEIIE
jgi:hypothetical protein